MPEAGEETQKERFSQLSSVQSPGPIRLASGESLPGYMTTWCSSIGGKGERKNSHMQKHRDSRM